MMIIPNGIGNCIGQTKLWINIDDMEYHSVYAFLGTYTESSLKFNDFQIVEIESPKNQDFYWCKKSGTLVFNNNTLSGNVTGNSEKRACMPAQANLKWVSKLD